MMSGHGANLIFFNKKIKIRRTEHSLTHFCLTLHPHSPSKWTSYVYYPLTYVESFGVVEAHFLIRTFLTRKRVIQFQESLKNIKHTTFHEKEHLLLTSSASDLLPSLLNRKLRWRSTTSI